MNGWGLSYNIGRMHSKFRYRGKQKLLPLPIRNISMYRTKLPISNVSPISKKTRPHPPTTIPQRSCDFLRLFLLRSNQGMVSAEDDLKLERKLAKKLKVKNGKLRGLDDEMNMLFGEVPSILGSAGDEEVMDDEESEDRDEEMYLKKKRKKRKVDVQLEEMENESDKDEEAEAEAEEDQTDEDEDEVVEADDEVEKEEPCEMLPELTEYVKYIAPHLRARARNEAEEHTQIRRRVRGLLNRLSETNVESITEEMSSIYRSIGRITGAQIISEEVLATCSGGPRGNEQYAAGFAAFVAGMACLVGIDFSAKLIASLAKSFEDEFMKEDNLSLRNLTLLLSYLYTFGVCSSDLIYNFLSILSKRLLEIDVSTILTILQCRRRLEQESHAEA